MPGRSTNLSLPSLSRRISSAPAPWSKIIPRTLNMRSGPSNPQVPFRPSRDRSGSTSSQERWSTLTLCSQGSSPLLQRIGPPRPLETLTSPSEKANPPNSSSLMVTRPLPGTLPLLPSSVLSPTEPWNCGFIPNTSFNFSAPVPGHRERSLTWTRPSDGTLERSSISNLPTWPDSGISRPVTSRMTAQETKQVPTKRKRPADPASVRTKFAASGTVGHATAALRSADSVTSARSAEVTTLAWNVRRRIETSTEYMWPKFARDLVWGTVEDDVSLAAHYSLTADPLP